MSVTIEPEVEQEAELLRAIRNAIPRDTQSRFNILMRRRRQNTLTDEEHSELLRLTKQIEPLDVLRLERLVLLARLRNTSVPELIRELGLKSRNHER